MQLVRPCEPFSSPPGSSLETNKLRQLQGKVRKQLLPALWGWRTTEQGWPLDLGVSHAPSHPPPAPRRMTKLLLNLLLATVCTAGSQPPWPFLQDGESTVVSIFLLKVYG